MQECTCRKASNNNIVHREYNNLKQLQVLTKILKIVFFTEKNKLHLISAGCVIGLVIWGLPVQFPSVPNYVVSLDKALHPTCLGECPCTCCKCLWIGASAKWLNVNYVSSRSKCVWPRLYKTINIEQLWNPKTSKQWQEHYMATCQKY